MIDLLLAGAGGAALGALATGVYHPNSRVFGPAIGWGPAGGRGLYLTFDDGPSPSVTEAILDALAGADAPAAFFMVGEHARRFSATARRVAAAGHEIGNHTQHHVKLHRCGPARIRAELEEAHLALADITGRPPRIFRAPHGYRNPFVARAARRLGYTVFGWSFGVWDTTRPPPPPEEIRRRVRGRLAPGAILLLHDGDGYDPLGDRRATAAALPAIVRDARAAGYEFRPLTELIA